MSLVADKVAKLIETFTDCITSERELEVSGRNGLQMVGIATALQQSCQTGHVVSIG